MIQNYKIVHYTKDGRDIFQEWLDSLKYLKAQTAIGRTVKRIEKGNFGKNHFCRDGVWELIIDTGPGYRVYYSVIDNIVVLLLCAGSKRTQQKDIDSAVHYLKNFKEENKNNGH